LSQKSSLPAIGATGLATIGRGPLSCNATSMLPLSCLSPATAKAMSAPSPDAIRPSAAIGARELMPVIEFAAGMDISLKLAARHNA